MLRFHSGNVEPVVEESNVVCVVRVEALVECVGGGEERVDPGLFEVERAYRTEAEAADLTTVEIGELDLDLLLVRFVLRQPALSVEDESGHEDPGYIFTLPTVPFGRVLVGKRQCQWRRRVGEPAPLLLLFFFDLEPHLGKIVLDDLAATHGEAGMGRRVEERVVVLPGIFIENQEAGRLAEIELPDQYAVLRVHGKLGLVGWDRVLCDHIELSLLDEEADDDILDVSVSVDESNVADQHRIGARHLGRLPVHSQ